MFKPSLLTPEAETLIMKHLIYSGTYPLIPWLHSTEPYEHIFGMPRQLRKGFDFADVLHLVRKLCSLIQGNFQMLTPQDQEHQTIEGYQHTYFHAVTASSELLS